MYDRMAVASQKNDNMNGQPFGQYISSLVSLIPLDTQNVFVEIS